MGYFSDQTPKGGPDTFSPSLLRLRTRSFLGFPLDFSRLLIWVDIVEIGFQTKIPELFS